MAAVDPRVWTDRGPFPVLRVGEEWTVETVLFRRSMVRWRHGRGHGQETRMGRAMEKHEQVEEKTMGSGWTRMEGRLAVQTAVHCGPLACPSIWEARITSTHPS
eukprot:scaffold2206_cov316-Pavlova_lutheri.AAC.9